VIKNGIDWVIGTGELERKIIAVTASVNHRDRGRRGLQALCDTLSAVSAQIVGDNPILRRATLRHRNWVTPENDKTTSHQGPLAPSIRGKLTEPVIFALLNSTPQLL